MKEKKKKIEEIGSKHTTVTPVHSCITLKLLLVITNSQNCPFKVVGVTELKLRACWCKEAEKQACVWIALILWFYVKC